MSDSCAYIGGPPLNTDISGIGVRVSFYLQTVFLGNTLFSYLVLFQLSANPGCLSARSTSPEEVTGALYTLLATNTGMAVTAFILGFKSRPEISLHDGLVVFYLLYISWVTVYFSLPANTKFPGQVKTLHLCSVIQSCILFALAFALLGTATTFGLTPECNHNAVVVLFRPFAVLDAGRILFLVLTALVLIIYGGIIYKDWKASIKRLGLRVAEHFKKKRPGEEIEINIHHNAQTATDPESRRTRTEDVDNSASVPRTWGYLLPKDKPASDTYTPNVDEKLVANLIIVLILWGLAVMNTELLIRWNNFAASDGSQSPWQFGQILPMILVVPPLISLVNVFVENGFRKADGGP
ncbi:hypothetical protein B0H16DRAFT_1884890 [Mycena metata]|uniref:Uncharacterized protein n=1 Tax=Mycena metata TaxID=1033252 RepID=A0AAD7NF58_9AGAR|nr:hypothetical protein B0H16DRAFT_1884890 [Mycena metata]